MTIIYLFLVFVNSAKKILQAHRKKNISGIREYEKNIRTIVESLKENKFKAKSASKY